MLKIVSPTGQGIRSDSWGSGKFRALRTKLGADGKLVKYEHQGVDFIAHPGQEAFPPIAGKVMREARPHVGELYSGILITNGYLSIKMFYFEPFPEFLREIKWADLDTPIGHVQDISARKPEWKGKMIPHVHVEIRLNPRYSSTKVEEAFRDGILIDPEILL